MRRFMHDIFVNNLAIVLSAGPLIEKQCAFGIGDTAPILHGAFKIAGHQNMVKLGQRGSMPK